MHGVMQDLRYALRGLAKSPGFTAVAVLTRLPARRASRIDPIAALRSE